MIDLWGVAANAFWVLGLALLLAAFSWANGVAVRKRIPLRSALSRPVRRALDGGLVLLCTGLAATARTLLGASTVLRFGHPLGQLARGFRWKP